MTLQMVDRRSLLASMLSAAAASSAGTADAAAEGLLSRKRLEEFKPVDIERFKVDATGGVVTYAQAGKIEGPLLLYFHGWGATSRVSLPLEYHLLDAGYRIVHPHRPGYAGTSLRWTHNDEPFAWETARAGANVAARLLDHLYGKGKWNVRVVGRSGGAPSALAFASLYPSQTRALVLVSGVTQPWTQTKLVPKLFQSEYEQSEWLSEIDEDLAKAIFGLLVKFKSLCLTKHDELRNVVGPDLARVMKDPAFPQVRKLIFGDEGDEKAEAIGTANDAKSIFLSGKPFCKWSNIKSPTLIIHDRNDPFVTFEHALAAKKILGALAELPSFRLGGHLPWFGPDAAAANQRRLEFLARYAG